MDHLRAIVLADGDLVAPPIPLPDDTLVIAADGGLRLASLLGLDVDVVVGDMDSVAPDDLAAAEQSGARIERHPADKDATDLELALDAAIAGGATDITVVGGAGGRLDHLLANALLLASHTDADLRWDTGSELATVCDPSRPAVIHGSPGDLVSLIPIDGSAQGVHTDGLKWPLDNEELISGSTRGISNELTGDTATISIGDGTLLVVQERTNS